MSSEEKERDEKVAFTSPQVTNFLNCGMCNELADAPVTLCQLGHTICDTCRKLFRNCSLCNGKFTNLRNFVCEGIIEKSVFKCKYFTNGCEAQVKGNGFRAHVLLCSFRPIYCNLTPCLNHPLTLQTYLKHMQRNHAVPGKCIESNTCDILITQDLDKILKKQERIRRAGDYHGIYPSYCIHLGNELFLLHTMILNDLVYWWIYTVSNENNALKYKSILALKQPASSYQIKWNGIVYPVRDGIELIQHEIPSVLPLATLKKLFVYTVNIGSPNKSNEEIKWNLILHLEKN